MQVYKTDLIMVRGDTESITVRRWNERLKVIVPFTDGDIVRFTVKKDANTTAKVLQKVVTEFTDGDAIIDILPSDTKGLRFGTYVYDVQVTDGDGAVTTIIPFSRFVIREEVTYE